MRNKQWKRFAEMKVTLRIKTEEGVVQKLLVFSKKNLSKIANLDQKTCKKKNNEREAREKQHNQLLIRNQQMQTQ